MKSILKTLVVILFLLVASPVYAVSTSSLCDSINQERSKGISKKVILQTLWDATGDNGLTVDQLVRLAIYVKRIR